MSNMLTIDISFPIGQVHVISILDHFKLYMLGFYYCSIILFIPI